MFKLCQDRSSWVEPVLSKDVSCSRTQHSDAGEARTSAPQSRVKHSTTESLYSLYLCMKAANAPGEHVHMCRLYKAFIN